MFEQAAIAVRNEQGYTKFHQLVDAAFDPAQVEVFLDSVDRRKLRVRDFETILERGLLGKEARALYAGLPGSDQGLTRERYLRRVETVPLELRQRFYRVYAYY